MQSEIRDGYWAVFDIEDADAEPGPQLVELVDARLTAFAARYGAAYPAAMKILLTDREGLTAYLRFPAEHHHRIRHSNFIERTFGETRRRAKVIGRFPASPTRKSYRPASRRNQLHQLRVGRARPRLARLARTHHDPRRITPAPRPTPQPAATTPDNWKQAIPTIRRSFSATGKLTCIPWLRPPNLGLAIHVQVRETFASGSTASLSR